MVEVPENNRNFNENQLKNKVGFHFILRITTKTGCKQNEAENNKSRLLGSIEKRAKNFKKSKQLTYKATEDIVADVHLLQKLLNFWARQGVNLARWVDAVEVETRQKYTASLKEASNNIESP